MLDHRAMLGAVPRGVLYPIKNDGAAALPIPNAADRLRRPFLGKAVLLEELAKCFQTRPIYAREETTQCGAMGKVSVPKECHERSPKGSQTMKEISQCPFPTHSVADQQGEKIERFITAQAATDQAYLMREGLQSSF